mmetsp:Transcript_62201/g.135092  ORF Transcript_62201/g.135092 Transcript_62201/m.135092 type:complete len:211 (+) Transcript_62201:328-960(+)
MAESLRNPWQIAMTPSSPMSLPRRERENSCGAVHSRAPISRASATSNPRSLTSIFSEAPWSSLVGTMVSLSRTPSAAVAPSVCARTAISRSLYLEASGKWTTVSPAARICAKGTSLQPTLRWTTRLERPMCDANLARSFRRSSVASLPMWRLRTQLLPLAIVSATRQRPTPVTPCSSTWVSNPSDLRYCASTVASSSPVADSLRSAASRT